jgi:hypothetical protein
MTNGWRIVATTPRDGGPPSKEWFIVAMEDPTAALLLLRSRRNVAPEVELAIDGKASEQSLRGYGILRGEIFSVLK